MDKSDQLINTFLTGDCNLDFEKLPMQRDEYLITYYTIVHGKLSAKVFYAPLNSFINLELKNEVDQNLMIKSLIDKKQISENYLTMINYKYCQSSPDKIGYILYPHYDSVRSIILDEYKYVIRKVFTYVMILYQNTGMIHGDLTLDNIYTTPKHEIIIGGFGRMRKGTCLDQIKELIWFILQIVNEYEMPELLAPKTLKILYDLNYLKVNLILNSLTQSQIDEIINYWLF